jgi:two-component system, NarL family, nitrate/nitrite response regulator NarL
MIRVAIVDDHPLARRGVEQILTESGRVQVVATASSPAELASALAGVAADLRPDVVVLDLYYEGGPPSLPAVTDLAATVRVLIISASGDRADVVGAVRAGAAGYVTKNSSPALLTAAVETVAAGGFALSPQLADMLQAELGTPAPGGVPAQRAPDLSAREEETLGLIARGFTHSQVANRMGVSKATVDTYVERIRVKLQVGNKAQLTQAALARMRPGLS